MWLAPFLLLLHLFLQYVSVDFHSRFLVLLFPSRNVFQMISVFTGCYMCRQARWSLIAVVFSLSSVRILLSRCFGCEMLSNTPLLISLQNLARPRQCINNTLASSKHAHSLLFVLCMSFSTFASANDWHTAIVAPFLFGLEVCACSPMLSGRSDDAAGVQSLYW